MDLALMVARSGLEAHHKSIEVISNNLANASTTAFKKNRAEFEDLPYQNIVQPGTPETQDSYAPGSIVVGTGVRMVDNKKIFTEGDPISTDKEFDVAIRGRGFFQVQLPNGSDMAYTRAGNFMKNDQGVLTLPNGYVVQPPITIPQGTQKVTIGEDGTVSVLVAGQSAETQVGQLQIFDFLNPDGLLPIGQNLYVETTASGVSTSGAPGQNELGTLKQGALEGSNVNIVEEMVNLIEAQRAFEVTSKAISAVDNMLHTINEVA